MRPSRLNLTAPINSLGFGTLGLNLLSALQTQEYAVSLWPIDQVDCPPDKEQSVRQAIALADLYDPAAPSIRLSQPFDLAHHVGKGPRMAITFFERDRLRDFEIHQLSQQDVVLASCQWMADILTDSLQPSCVKVSIARPGIDRRIFHEAVAPGSELLRQIYEVDGKGLDSMTLSGPPTVFLAVGMWSARKGHDLLPGLFADAFPNGENYRLVMASHNVFLSSEENDKWAQRFTILGDRAKILRNRLPSQESLAKLMACADCGVFFSRGEGWNFEAVEMLSMGKQVVITNATAHSEYAECSGSRVVDIDRLEPCVDDRYFDGFGYWASFGARQRDQAISHLREVHRLVQLGQLEPNSNGIEIAKRFSWSQYANDLLSCFA